MEDKDKPERQPQGGGHSYLGAWIAIGMGTGIVPGTAFGNIAIGAGIGLVLGTAIGTALDQQNKRGGSDGE